jgi:hypothetical protein
MPTRIAPSPSFGLGLVEHALRLRLSVLAQRLSVSRVLGADDRGGEERGVHRAGATDRERADRDPRGHLHDGEQRVDPAQDLRLDRHAEHGEDRLGRAHAGQMRRAAGAGDDHLEAAPLGLRGVLEQQVRRAMRGHDARLERHAERFERECGVLHGLPIRLRAHDDADERTRHARDVYHIYNARMRRAWLLTFATSAASALLAYACASDEVRPDSAASDDAGAAPDTFVVPDAADAAEAASEPPPVDAGPDTSDAACVDTFGDGIPPDLACTGLYADWGAKTVALENKSYTPGLVLWSDGAEKARWLYLPPGAKIDTSNLDEWVFPVGTKVWKEFRLGGKRVETRMFWKRQADAGESDLDWAWTTYRWSADETHAPRQDDAVTNVNDAGYEIPEHLACYQCHKGRADALLGVEAVNLGNDGAQGVTLAALVDAGLLTSPPPSTSIAIPEDSTGHAKDAIGWLHVNCGTACHNANASAAATQSGLFMLLHASQLLSPDGGPEGGARVQDLDTYATAVNVPCNMQPYRGEGYYRIHAGDVALSLEVRLAETRDGGGSLDQMPPIVTHQVDVDGTSKLEAWVSALPEGGL